ncbi:hypothetical protein BC830DRAFT_1152283 [Chytriomyces sp. MP71]|nr:hypothetical protein BC830DRAFT_1152283 [Chytriomyces sp. MP71]
MDGRRKRGSVLFQIAHMSQAHSLLLRSHYIKLHSREELTPRAPATHEIIQPPARKIQQNLTRRGLAVKCRVRLICELAREEPPALLCELLGSENDFGAEEVQETAAFDGGGFDVSSVARCQDDARCPLSPALEPPLGALHASVTVARCAVSTGTLLRWGASWCCISASTLVSAESHSEWSQVLNRARCTALRFRRG